MTTTNTTTRTTASPNGKTIADETPGDIDAFRYALALRISQTVGDGRRA